MSDDNTNIEMSYKINLEIVNNSRNKTKIAEVDNQIGEVISDLVDKVEESLTQKPQQKKRFKRYRTQESRKKETLKTIHCYLVAFPLAQSSTQKILQRKLDPESINITRICH